MSAPAITPSAESTTDSPPRLLRNWPGHALSLVTVLGMMDSGYLTIQHFRKVAVTCGLGDCERVLTSGYSMFLGLPVSVYGFAFYAMIFLLPAWNVPRWMIPVLAGAGVAIHSYFVYLQAYVIHAYCMYCLFSALMTLMVFLISLVEARLRLNPAK